MIYLYSTYSYFSPEAVILKKNIRDERNREAIPFLSGF
jgi:hypothetical protein